MKYYMWRYTVKFVVLLLISAGPLKAKAPFDGLQYIASYGDLIAALGANAAAGARHYQQFGRAEGRSPDSFNEMQYLANYADLRAAFGSDTRRATIHYILYGYAEGRTDHAGTKACPARLACQKRVGSGNELAAALGTATCGCEILLADGVYRGDFALRRVCPANQPIVIRAESPLRPVIASTLTLNGANSAVVGVRFIGAEARVIVGGASNRVLRNSFSSWQNAAIKATAGTDAEIAYNELASPAPWSRGGKTRIGIMSNQSGGGLNLNAHVYGNHFHDFPAKPGSSYASGQADALEICGARQPISFTQSGWVIERNLIERHRQAGAAVIDIKCSGTTVQFNTILASPGGRIDVRNGYSSSVIGNWLEDTDGMILHGGYHRVLGNRLIRSAGIALTAGTVPMGYTGPTVAATGGRVHQPAHNLLLAGNVAAAVRVGLTYGGTFEYPADGNVIEQFVGPIYYGMATNTTVRPQPTVALPTAIKLTPGDVGPWAGGSCL